MNPELQRPQPAVKKKVIVALFVAGAALTMAWFISRIAFSEMLNTVHSISNPDARIELLNSLFRDVTRLDQEQRNQALKNKNYSGQDVFNQSAKILNVMDSLASLYKDNHVQLARINEMKRLLDDRDSLFLAYLKVRQGLIGGKEIKRQLQSLSGLIDKSSSDLDTTIITTEQKFLTTTVQPKVSATTLKEGGLLKRIFGKRKTVIDTEKVVKEELKVTVDTLARTKSGQVIQQMENAVSSIQRRQVQRSVSFIYQEIQLSNLSNVLINKILSILQQVEKEALSQNAKKNQGAVVLVAQSISTIEYIMLAFILIAAILAYMILSDISRSNRYREDLEQARDEAEFHSRAKERFLSNMSHEIRTPLQSIIGYAEQLKKESAGDERATSAIYKSSLHLLHLVNDILDYSKISSGRLRFNRQPFKMSELIDEVSMIMATQAEDKNLRFGVKHNVNDDVVLIGDSYRLRQILYNLLGNAIKFTDRGEVGLNVSCKNIKRRSFYTFEVYDTGKGINTEDVLRIFDEFEQTELTDARLAAGAGLGLSIVKALVQGQGGAIDVISEPGKGSRFIVKLRYLIPKANFLKAKKQRSETVFDRLKVWIIDDDTSILHLGSVILNNAGISYEAFNDPLKVADREIPTDLTCILMDVRMPGMSGLELCSLIRNKVGDGLRIYALTAQVLPGEHAGILEAGFNGILPKPFRETEFIELMAKVSQSKQERQPEPLHVQSLRKMVMGDDALMEKIIKRFEEDTLADIDALNLSIDNEDRDAASMLVHRIAGRTAQMGATSISQYFREFERYLINNGSFDETFKNDLNNSVTELKQVMKLN